jgi:hypothetical protein
MILAKFDTLTRHILPNALVVFVNYIFVYRSRSDELTLNAGLIVNIINKYEDGWWRIESEGNYGLYPSNYLEEINNVSVFDF